MARMTQEEIERFYPPEHLEEGVLEFTRTPEETAALLNAKREREQRATEEERLAMLPEWRRPCNAHAIPQGPDLLDVICGRVDDDDLYGDPIPDLWSQGSVYDDNPALTQKILDEFNS